MECPRTDRRNGINQWLRKIFSRSHYSLCRVCIRWEEEPCTSRCARFGSKGEAGQTRRGSWCRNLPGNTTDAAGQILEHKWCWSSVPWLCKEWWPSGWNLSTPPRAKQCSHAGENLINCQSFDHRHQKDHLPLHPDDQHWRPAWQAASQSPHDPRQLLSGAPCAPSDQESQDDQDNFNDQGGDEDSNV